MSQTPITTPPEKDTLIYSAALKFTKTNDYGVSMPNIGDYLKGGGNAPVHLDVLFEGSTTAGILSGKISGIDYLACQADGSLALTLFERIETSLGAISFQGTGKAVETDNPTVMKFNQKAVLVSHVKELAGINGLKLRGEGEVFLASGEVRLSLFAA